MIAILLLAMAVTTSVNISPATPIPIVTPNSTIIAVMNGTNATQYYQLTQTGIIHLDMSSLPASPNLSSLSTSLFPANAEVSCAIRSQVMGDVPLSTQTLTVIMNQTIHNLVSVELANPRANAFSIRVTIAVVMFVVAILHLVACGVPAYLGGWTVETAEQTLRVLILTTFFCNFFFEILIIVNLFGPSTVQTMILWSAATIGMANALATIIHCGHNYRELCSKSRGMHADIAEETPLSISIQRLFGVGSVFFYACLLFILVIVIMRLYNWGLSTLLVEWAPLYTAGLRSEAVGAIWVFFGSLLLVGVLMWLWTGLDFIAIGDNYVDASLRKAPSLCVIGLDDTQIMLMLTTDVVLCFSLLVFCILAFFSTITPLNLTTPLLC